MHPLRLTLQPAHWRSWAQHRGIVAAVAPADFGGLRGAAATQDLQPFDAAVSVPEACLITADTALGSDIVRHLSGCTWLTPPQQGAWECRLLPTMRLAGCLGACQGKALSSLGLHRELIMLLHTMIDRHDQESPWAPFWRSFPPTLTTGMRRLRAAHAMATRASSRQVHIAELVGISAVQG